MFTIRFNGVPTDQLFESREKAYQNIAAIFGEVPGLRAANLVYWPTVSAHGNSTIEIVELK